MQVTKTYRSELDASVNFLLDSSIECRLVRRGDTAIIYVSSQRGCKQACRMCHLTHKKLTDDTLVTEGEFYTQILTVLSEIVQSRFKPLEVHVNFMARGEPLLNPLLEEPTFWSNIHLYIQTTLPGVPVEFKISTIFPVDRRVKKFPRPVDIYYSLYSMDPVFRKKWLPKAEDPMTAIKTVRHWIQSGSRLYVHHALIAGQNDRIDDAERCSDLILSTFEPDEIKNIRLNLVKFNTPDVDKYQESSEDAVNAYEMVWASKGFRTQIVSRVGFDVAASCGMFMT